jgi:photosystem II stability/assembly factor-like uncharacterized protein
MDNKNIKNLVEHVLKSDTDLLDKINLTKEELKGLLNKFFIEDNGNKLKKLTDDAHAHRPSLTVFSQEDSVIQNNLLMEGSITFPDNSVQITAGSPVQLDFTYLGHALTKKNLKDGARFWQTVAMTTNGQRQIAMNIEGNKVMIYESNDNGNNWNFKKSISNNAITENYDVNGNENTDVVNCVSANGKYQSLCIGNVGIYKSKDYGTTWDKTDAGTSYWMNISMSASGQYQSAVAPNYGIYCSRDFGETWAKSNTWAESQSDIVSKTPKAIHVSASGQYQTVVNNNKSIYISNNFGLTWKYRKNLDSNTDADVNPAYEAIFNSVSMSSSGQYQTVAIYGYSIYSSLDYGETWTKSTIVPSETLFGWNRLAITSDGRYQFAVANEDTDMNIEGGVFYSSNYGQNWVKIPGQDNIVWSVVVSETGQYLTIADYESGISTLTIPSLSNNFNTIQLSDNANKLNINNNGIVSVDCNYSSFGCYNLEVTNDITKLQFKNQRVGGTYTIILKSTSEWSYNDSNITNYYNTPVIMSGNRSILTVMCDSESEMNISVKNNYNKYLDFAPVPV